MNRKIKFVKELASVFVAIGLGACAMNNFVQLGEKGSMGWVLMIPVALAAMLFVTLRVIFSYNECKSSS